MLVGDALSGEAFWTGWWTALFLTASLGALLGVLIGRLVDGRAARRIRTAQAWVTIALCLLAILLSIVAIIGVGGLSIWPSFLLLGFVLGLTPWTEIYSHR